jgi:hypothetical protein
MVTLRGKLRYCDGDTRVVQCPCEAVKNPPLWVLLVSCAAGVADSATVTQILQNANWHDGDCIAVQGNWLTPRETLCVDQQAKFIAPCPRGPC